MRLQTSPESPVPVRRASQLMGDWIGRCGTLWVEGQIAELKIRTSRVWITLRDPDQDKSIGLTCPRSELERVSGGIREGQRVVVQVKPEYYQNKGQLQWKAWDFRPVGVGALLAQIEQLRKLLAAQGLFAEERKRSLPLIPRRIGLVCGRASAARQDVEVNARLRWPAAEFEVREVPVQGPPCVSAVVAALVELDAMPEVDVIVITRGGGSFEDLLPFSNEAMVRAVSKCRTPVISAIGHEEDVPLLDLVADWRASTPTAAGKHVVPAVAEEITKIGLLRRRANTSIGNQLQTQQHHLASHTVRCRGALGSRLRSERGALAALLGRPVLMRPGEDLTRRRTEVGTWRDRGLRAFRNSWRAAATDLSHQTARMRSLSPQATLDRGYAVVQREGRIVRQAAGVPLGAQLGIRLARGSLGAAVTSVEDGPPAT